MTGSSATPPQPPAPLATLVVRTWFSPERYRVRVDVARFTGDGQRREARVVLGEQRTSVPGS